MQPKKFQKKSLIKVVALFCFIVSAFVLVRFTPLGGYLEADQLGRLMQKAGFWAPALFIMIYAVGVCLFVPGTVLGAMGAILFGPFRGFIYVWTGAMIGAAAAFFIGRYLGREFTASLIGDKLKKYDEAIERNGFATVLYLRLLYFPFTPMNFGMGLTRVRFRDYLFGTGVGIFTGTFIFIFFISTLKDVLSSGNWGELLSSKAFLSVSLFILSLFFPKIINKIKKKDGIQKYGQ